MRQGFSRHTTTAWQPLLAIVIITFIPTKPDLFKSAWCHGRMQIKIQLGSLSAPLSLTIHFPGAFFSVTAPTIDVAVGRSTMIPKSISTASQSSFRRTRHSRACSMHATCSSQNGASIVKILVSWHRVGAMCKNSTWNDSSKRRIHPDHDWFSWHSVGVGQLGYSHAH